MAYYFDAFAFTISMEHKVHFDKPHPKTLTSAKYREKFDVRLKDITFKNVGWLVGWLVDYD